MLLARVMYPVETLGPGKRIALWVCGCHRRCPHCANPELQPFDPVCEISVADAVQALLPLCAEADGLTVTGGEPFEQAGDLCALLEALPVRDVLIFTGYTLEALQARHDGDTDRLLQLTTVLVDGEYREEENRGSMLRGSDNQRILILRPDAAARYQAYLALGRRCVQLFRVAEDLYAVGLHDAGFTDETHRRLNLLKPRET